MDDHEDSLLPERSIRGVIARYAALRAEFGDAIGDPELLEPSERHFPDDFTGDADSVGQLLRRMVGYAPIADDLAIEIAIDPRAAGGGGGCGTGACGSHEEGTGPAIGGVVELEDRYRVVLAKPELAHPTLLAAALARAVGGLVLGEADETIDGPTSEIAAAMCGFGLVLLGGSALYTKGCGGLRMQRVTHLSPHELALATTVFAELHGCSVARGKSHLEPTPREALDEAARVVAANGALVDRLRDVPESLADGVFDVARGGAGLFGRLFGAKRSAPKDDLEAVAAAAAAKRTARSPEESRRLAEIAALVDDALDER